MELTLYEQVNSFWWSFVLGALLTAVYIVVMVVRELSPPSKSLLVTGDILFMVFAAFVNFLFAAALTNGIVRFYTIFAECISFVLIYFTIGRVLKRSAAVVFGILCRIYHFISDPICNLIRKVTCSLKKKCKIILKKTKK